MRVNKYVLPALVLIVLLGTVAAAQVTDQWIVTGKQMIDASHMTSSTDIRGWMTLQQVADGFGVERGELYQVLGIPAEVPPETALREMEGILPGFEVSMVREMIASYLGEGDQLMTEPAEAGSRPDAVLIPENNEDVQTTSTPLPARAINADHTPMGDGSGTGPTPVPESEILTGSDIKGRHTLQDIADQAQVPLSDLLQALNLPADTDPGTKVRDLVQNGQVAEVRVVQDVVRALQVP